MTAPPEPIAIVEKNSREDVRVSLDEFHGVQLIDVRTFADFKAGAVESRGPTKKGVSLNIARLPALIAGLEAARDEARRRGLLPGD